MNDLDNISMPSDQKLKASAIIHSASVAAGATGAGLAQLFIADSAIITPIQIGMIVALGEVFDQNITKSAAKAILDGMVASFAGRTVSQILVGWVPFVGNAMNASTAAGITELIGWRAAESFYKNQLRSLNPSGLCDFNNSESIENDSEENSSPEEQPHFSNLEDFLITLQNTCASEDPNPKVLEALAKEFINGNVNPKVYSSECKTLYNRIEMLLDETLFPPLSLETTHDKLQRLMKSND